MSHKTYDHWLTLSSILVVLDDTHFIYVPSTVTLLITVNTPCETHSLNFHSVIHCKWILAWSFVSSVALQPCHKHYFLSLVWAHRPKLNCSSQETKTEKQCYDNHITTLWSMLYDTKDSNNGTNHDAAIRKSDARYFRPWYKVWESHSSSISS